MQKYGQMLTQYSTSSPNAEMNVEDNLLSLFLVDTKAVREGKRSETDG